MKRGLILLFLLVSCLALSAQQPSRLSYYYKGDVRTLSKNSQHFFVYVDTSEISMLVLQKIYEVTEVVQTIVPNVVGLQVYIANQNYDSVVSSFKQLDYVLDVEPVIGDSVTNNVSWLFYSPLRSHDLFLCLMSKLLSCSS